VTALRVGVVGVGSMGRHHARVLSSLADVELVAVADLDSRVARRVAAATGARVYADHRRMLRRERLDAVCVAVTTDQHHAVGLDCLRAGVHVLMEKPLAATVAEGESLAATAEEHGVVLAAGHVERFNPALRALRRLIQRGELGRVTSVIARRVGGCPPRAQDVNIVVDLAIHDLDICRWLLGREPSEVSAVIGRAHLADRFDHAEILLDFAGVGCFVQANWITPVSIRTLAVTGERAYAELDYLTQRLELYRIRSRRPHEGFQELIQSLDAQPAESVAVDREEPLRLELEAFLRDVRSRGRSSVGAGEALAAMRLAERVVAVAVERPSVALRAAD
jgi:UDP-N-acetylglucosamine 3-dehydrogenase